jgi:hypothetical protein
MNATNAHSVKNRPIVSSFILFLRFLRCHFTVGAGVWKLSFVTVGGDGFMAGLFGGFDRIAGAVAIENNYLHFLIPVCFVLACGAPLKGETK